MASSNVQLPRIVSPDYFVEQDGVTFAGSHLLLDLWGAINLEDAKQVEQVLIAAAEDAGATALHAHVHRFESGGGVSGVVVLAESHISIHTWPERAFAAIDIFMCGACDPYKSIPKIHEFFAPEKLNISEQKRGVR
jgi:S-adenosylmethionine decarboxylase